MTVPLAEKQEMIMRSGFRLSGGGASLAPRRDIRKVPAGPVLPAAEPVDLADCLMDVSAQDLVIEMAHDLRSPLSAILFLAETLQRGESGEVNETQRSQLGLIYSAALCLCGAASDVLELARGGNRLLDHTAVPFSLSEVRSWVRDLVRPMAEQKGLALEMTTPEPDRRLGHPRALSRVLLNLATNGLKATDQGSVSITATPGRDHRVMFSVSDTGPGLDEPSLQTLYQPWRKRTASRSQFSGTGLGLAICRKLVAGMGSELQVESTVGKGTRFYFELDLPPAGA